MFNLITIGDAVWDTHVLIDDASVECDRDKRNCRLCFDFAAKVPVKETFQALGGNAANVACGAAKLGLSAAVLTTLGNDPNGRMIKSALKKFGVSIELVSADSKNTTRYSIVLNFQGERTILSHYEKKNYHWPKKLAPTDWIYYTSLSEGFEPIHEQLLTYLKKYPTVRLAFNPGSFQIKNAMSKVKEAIKRADLLFLNLEEAEKILGSSQRKEKTANAFISQLVQLGAKEVIITDAERGAFAGDADECWQIATFPVKPVAKTGAGDAFSAGYLAARSYEHDIPTALRWGIANSCSVIGQYGAQKGLLDKAGVEKMLAKFSKVKARQVA